MDLERFDIPVVLFIFKRDKAVEVLKRIATIKPSKLYIMADYGRNDEEKAQADRCRMLVENAIDWDCDVIKNYATENRGVFGNIGLGSKWVFEREDRAIFLEDDNLPELTFFEYCKQLLSKYEDDNRILWVCGTNYLEKYNPQDGASYMFTRHMLPCGWASWASKFNKFYDENLSLYDDPIAQKKARSNSYSYYLYRQYKRSWRAERSKVKASLRPVSWDYQMDFAVKVNGLYGIAPAFNQIKNIGVDEHSIHGGTSLSSIMTERFCGMDSFPLNFPLVHPKSVSLDSGFEKEIARVVQYPVKVRLKNLMTKIMGKRQ